MYNIHVFEYSENGMGGTYEKIKKTVAPQVPDIVQRITCGKRSRAVWGGGAKEAPGANFKRAQKNPSERVLRFFGSAHVQVHYNYYMVGQR